MDPAPRKALHPVADPYFLLLGSGGFTERATLLLQRAHR